MPFRPTCEGSKPEGATPEAKIFIEKFIKDNMYECESLACTGKVYRFHRYFVPRHGGISTGLVGVAYDYVDSGLKLLRGNKCPLTDIMFEKGARKPSMIDDRDLAYEYMDFVCGERMAWEVRDDCGGNLIYLPDENGQPRPPKVELQVFLLKHGDVETPRYICCFVWDGWNLRCGLAFEAFDGKTIEEQDTILKKKCPNSKKNYNDANRTCRQIRSSGDVPPCRNRRVEE